MICGVLSGGRGSLQDHHNVIRCDQVRQRFRSSSNLTHKYEKPLAANEAHLLRWTSVGNLTICGTGGSGSFLEAAVRLGRSCIIFEPHTGYYDLICERLDQVLVQLDSDIQDFAVSSGEVKTADAFNELSETARQTVCDSLWQHRSSSPPNTRVVWQSELVQLKHQLSRAEQKITALRAMVQDNCPEAEELLAEFDQAEEEDMEQPSASGVLSTPTKKKVRVHMGEGEPPGTGDSGDDQDGGAALGECVHCGKVAEELFECCGPGCDVRRCGKCMITGALLAVRAWCSWQCVADDLQLSGEALVKWAKENCPCFDADEEGVVLANTKPR